MVSPELVIFAINSAVRLGKEARNYYIASTQDRQLTVILPDFSLQPAPEDAIAFFRKAGKKYIDQSAFLSDLEAELNSTKTATQIIKAILPGDIAQLKETYDLFFSIRLAEDGRKLNRTEKDNSNAGTLSDEAFISLLRIRQWQKGDSPHPSLMQRVAATLVDLSIDYFTQVPGAIQTDSKHGKALAALLKGLDEINFNEVDSVENIGDLPGKLLLATLETVSENSSSVTSDPKFQELITLTTRSLSLDVAEHIQVIRDAGGNLNQQQRVIAWAEIVFSSVLKSGGKSVLSNPEKYLKIFDTAHQDLTSSVGIAVLDAILSQPEGDLDRVFSQDSLDSVVKAGFQVISRHPGLLMNDSKEALTAIISQTASDLGNKTAIFGPDFLSETLCLILDKTGDNIELFWPDKTRKPKHNVLLIAVKTTIDIISAQPADDAKWALGFTRKDMDDLVATTLDEIALNPGWLFDKKGNMNSNLTIALRSMLLALRNMEDRRISTADATLFIKSGLKAVARHPSFLTKISDGKPAIGAIFDAIIGTITRETNDTGGWTLVRREMLESITQSAMAQLSEKGVTKENISALANEIKVIVNEANKGERLSLENLQLRISTIAQ